MELIVSPRTERQSLFYPLSTSCLQISARGSRKQRVSCTRVVNRDADMHVHAESVQGCAIRVRGLVWHPLYVHYCTSDRYLLAPVSLSQSEFFVLRALHTPWYTPSRVGEHRVVWLSFDLLSPSFSLVSVYGRTHEKENEISFPPFFLSPPLLLFSFLFLSILYFCVYLCRSRPREVERRWSRARRWRDLFLQRNSATSKYRKLHVNRARTLAFVFDSVIRIRIG